jgi:hypothetical protein
MGPNKPSVSQLSEIEKIICLEFKKGLRTYCDKANDIDIKKSKSCDTTYHLLAKRPKSIEPMMAERRFYYYKSLLDFLNYTENWVEREELVTLKIFDSTTKDLFNKYLA